VTDFLSELRREVVGAHAARRRRSRLGRAASGLRAWLRPRSLVGAAAVTAAVVALVLGIGSLRAPMPSGGPRVLGVVDVGGNPVDGTFHEGSLWIADFRGRALVRVDPRARRAGSRIRLAGEPASVASGGAGLWSRTWRPGGSSRTEVSRIDPAAGRVTTRTTSGLGNAMTVGADAVWVARTEVPPEGIDRLDARTAERTRRVDVPHVYGLAAGGGAVWALGGDGTVVDVDAATGRVRDRWPRIAVSSPLVENENSIVADDEGAWALASGQGVRAMLVRLESGRAPRRLPVDAQALPPVTAAFGSVWIATRPDPRGPYHLERLDPATGTTTGSVAVGAHRPVALIAAGDVLAVAGGDGAVVLVDPGD
jgi:outer membrane protein assembly factor BamB